MAIENFRLLVESDLLQFIQSMGEKNQLRDACEYALLKGGKRLRPILTHMIACALDRGLNVAPSALSVEFFHTASLIADDLPCMDNDEMRRNVPCLHKVYGESVAILASYALIAEGYGGIYRNSLLNPKADAMLCIEAARKAAGIQGATNGQFLDLYPPDASFGTIKKIIEQKTVTLFEISFIFGWVFGGGEPSRLPLVKKAAAHLGMAFQIADDLLDFDQDVARQCPINIAVAMGRNAALSHFDQEMLDLEMSLRGLGLWTESFQEVVDFLFAYGKS